MTKPTITSIAPNTGKVGTHVLISGTHLGTTTSVKFGNVNASFTASSNSISTSVPTGAKTGLITVTTPDGVATLPLTGIDDINGGRLHVIALQSGNTFAWGLNEPPLLGNTPGQVYSSGIGSRDGFNVAVRTPPLSNILAVTGGETFSAHLRADGQVLIIGASYATPPGTQGEPIPIPNMHNVKAISGGYAHLLAIRNDGKVLAYGRNYSGELGDGTTTNRLIEAVEVLGISDVAAIAAGDSYSLAVLSNGTVYSWGVNIYGQLGNGTTIPHITPQIVPGLLSMANVTSAGSHSLALRSDGAVFGWGRNSQGQVGDGTTNNRLSPIQISGLTSVVSLSGGDNHSVALRADGHVFGWGGNNHLQIDSTGVDKLLPVLITTINDVIKIHGSASSTTVIKNDGSVFAWGSGLLGDGSTIGSATPVQVSVGFVISDTSIVIPSPPTGITSAPGNNMITIGWNQVDDATSYNIYIASVPGVTKNNFSGLPEGAKHTVITNDLTIQNLVNDRQYFFVITTQIVDQESIESTERSEIPSESGAIKILPPRNLSALGISQSSILLTWINDSVGETGYIIERKLDNEFEPIESDAIPVNINSVVKFLDASLKADTAYTYRAKTVRDAASGTEISDYSNLAIGVTKPLPTPPSRSDRVSKPPRADELNYLSPGMRLSMRKLSRKWNELIGSDWYVIRLIAKTSDSVQKIVIRPVDPRHAYAEWIIEESRLNEHFDFEPSELRASVTPRKKYGLSD